MHQGISILAVDDHEPNLMALRVILQDIGHMLCTTSGEDALRYLLNQNFDLIILDVVMPNMDGFQTAARIRENPRTRQTPIIFLTAKEDDENRIRRTYDFDPFSYLVKPIVPEALRTKVRAFIQPEQQQ